MKIVLIVVAILVCFCGQSICQNSANESPFGVFQGGEYLNHFFAFKFKLPAKWHTLTAEEMAKATEEGTKNARAGGAGSDALIERSKKFERIDLAVSKKEFGETENAVIGLSLMKQPSSSITAKMISEVTKEAFLNNPDFVLTRDISSERLGNRDLVTFEMGLRSFPKQRVRTYTTMVGSYSLSFAITYWDEDSLKVMLNSLNTLDFQSK